MDGIGTPTPVGLRFLLGEMNVSRGGDAFLFGWDREQEVLGEVLRLRFRDSHGADTSLDIKFHRR